MTHYVCTGTCGGRSDTPGVCQAEGCSKHGKPLVACDCVDEQHTTVIKASESDDDVVVNL